MNQPRSLSPAAARVKRAVRQAVAHLGHIDGAQATVGRGRSTVGRWMNLNDPDLPCLDSTLAIDEVLVAMGKGPVLLQALASELGFVVIDVTAGDEAPPIGEAAAEHAQQFGEFMAKMALSYSDGEIDGEEASEALAEMDEGIVASLRLRAALAARAG